MKRTWRWAMIMSLLAIIAAVPAVNAEERQLLAYRFVSGEVHEYRLTHITESLSPTKDQTEVILRFTVNAGGVEPDGSAKINITIHPEQIKLIRGRETIIVKPEVSTNEWGMPTPFSELDGESITMTVNQMGYCRDMRGPEVSFSILTACAAADPAGELDFLDGAQWTVFPVRYPVEPVGIGEVWEFSPRDVPMSKVPMNKWRYSGNENGTALLVAEPTGKVAYRAVSSMIVQGRRKVQTQWDLTVEGSARAWVNPETGWIEKCIFEEAYSGTRSSKKGIGFRRTTPASVKVSMTIEKMDGN